MPHTRCNYCGQVVSFIEIRGNSTCPVCRQSSTSCCEGGSCHVSAGTRDTVEKPQEAHAPASQHGEILEHARLQ